MNNQLEVEALETLINAVQKYRGELETNKVILVNAANLCDQAMGSDAISQKHIAALNSAITELEKTSQIVEKVAEALKDDLHKAKEVMDKIGWEQFTDAVIQCISDRCEGVIFMLWGNFARTKASLIDHTRHHVFEAAHPSPLARGAFFGCRHFSRANEALVASGRTPIDWQL